MAKKTTPTPEAQPDQQIQLSALVSQVEQLVSQLEQAESRLKEMGIADPTTGLYSYRYFLGRVSEEVARADRFNLEISCLMVSLDNPSFEGMLEVAKMLKEQCRVYDIPARWGQHELVMLLPATDLDGAQTFTERFRLLVEATFVEHDSLAGLTVSCGVATYPSAGIEDAQGLVEAADAAAHAAAQAGRNRTVLRN